jgi:transposase
MTVITGSERHRRWSDEDRVRILAAIEEPGAVVADVARRDDVCTRLVYKWRRAARRTLSAAGCGISPVIVETAKLASFTSPPSQSCASGVIEVDIN